MPRRKKFAIHKKGALSLLELVEKNESVLKTEYNLNGIRGLVTKLIALIKEQLLKGNKIYFPNLGDLEIKCKQVYVPPNFLEKDRKIPTLYLKFTTNKTFKKELNSDDNPYKEPLLTQKGCLSQTSDKGGSHG